MSGWEISVAAGCCFAAAIVQSVASFGFAVVVLALLPLLGVEIRQVIVGITVLVVPNIAIALWRVRRHVSIRRVGWVLLGIPLGTPVGLYLLACGPEWLLRGLLGGVLVAAAAEPFLRRSSEPRPEHRGWAFVAGVACGALGAALSAGGPPVVVYFYGRRWAKDATKAAVTLTFAGSVLWRLVAYVAQAPLTGKELLTLPLGLMAMAFWPAVVAGTLIGERLFGALSQGGFRRAVAAMLVVCGVYQIGKAAGAW